MQEVLASETGAPLSDAARWSKRLRADLSGARIVTGPRAEAAAAALGTAAFTVGNRVFFGVGVTPSDETVLAHELTHVVQQMGATVPSPDQLKMTSPDDPVEREARGEGGDHSPGAHGAAPGGHGAAPGAHAAGGEAAIAAFPFQMGPGGGAGRLFPGPKNPQLDAFKYFEQHGRAHLKRR